MENKKTLILNGSPHKNGDTVFIINQIKDKLEGEIEEIYAYNFNIKPCIDCRYCWKKEGCAIKDEMDKIYKDDYDIIIIASPVYMQHLTPPMFSILTRLNMIWCNGHFINKKHDFKPKQGILVLTGGGEGNPKPAIEMAKNIFRYVNANFDIEKNYIYSLNTNNIPAKDDENLKRLLGHFDINV